MSLDIPIKSLIVSSIKVSSTGLVSPRGPCPPWGRRNTSDEGRAKWGLRDVLDAEQFYTTMGRTPHQAQCRACALI